MPLQQCHDKHEIQQCTNLNLLQLFSQKLRFSHDVPTLKIWLFVRDSMMLQLEDQYFVETACVFTNKRPTTAICISVNHMEIRQ